VGRPHKPYIPISSHTAKLKPTPPQTRTPTGLNAGDHHPQRTTAREDNSTCSNRSKSRAYIYRVLPSSATTGRSSSWSPHELEGRNQPDTMMLNTDSSRTSYWGAAQGNNNIVKCSTT